MSKLDSRKPSIVTLTTDFGTDDVFVGVMKGVLLGIAPDARLVDLTHAVPPQAIRLGAFLLRLSVPYFPAGSIHVAVVDPGVGTDRRPVCVETSAGVFIGPDNGVLAPAAQEAGIVRVIDITNEDYWLPRVGSTFHGRDIFAPVAAHVAAGVPLDAIGQPGRDLTPCELPRARRETGRPESVLGKVIHCDRFGNLMTNVTADDLAAFSSRKLSVSIGGVEIHGLASSYTEAPEGALLALLNSWGLLEVALRDGSASSQLSVSPGSPIVVTVH